MTDEATYDFISSDYYEELGFIREELELHTEKLEALASAQADEYLLLNSYVPQVYTVLVLFLGSFVCLALFRFLSSFLGRVFNDTTKL